MTERPSNPVRGIFYNGASPVRGRASYLPAARVKANGTGTPAAPEASNGANRRRFFRAAGLAAAVLFLGGAAFLASRMGQDVKSLGSSGALGLLRQASEAGLVPTSRPRLDSVEDGSPQLGRGRAKATVGGEVFWLDIAATPALRAKGLSGRNGIPADGGMIFLFDIPARHAFWMKDMKFPIDIIWVKGEDVLFTAENVPPPPEGAADGELPRYAPPAPADKVIEIRAGAVGRLGVQTGSRLKIEMPGS